MKAIFISVIQKVLRTGVRWVRALRNLLFSSSGSEILLLSSSLSASAGSSLEATDATKSDAPSSLNSLLSEHLNKAEAHFQTNAAKASGKAFEILRGYTVHFYDAVLARLALIVQQDEATIFDPYVGKRVIAVVFHEPFVPCADYNLLGTCIIREVVKHGYTAKCDQAKFTVALTVRVPAPERLRDRDLDVVTFTISKALTIIKDGKATPLQDLFAALLGELLLLHERYKFAIYTIYKLVVKIIYKDLGGHEDINYKDVDHAIRRMIQDVLSRESLTFCAPPAPVPISSRPEGSKKRVYNRILNKLRPAKTRKPKSFIVADTETIQVDNVHVPYAVGFLVVHPGQSLLPNETPDSDYFVFYSEDQPLSSFPVFKERSNAMLSDFMIELEKVSKATGIKSIYFHNLSRFDGIILLRYLVSEKRNERYLIKPLMRNHVMYQLSVFFRSDGGKGAKLLLRFKDSLRIFGQSLRQLAKTMCPELGEKGTLEMKPKEIVESVISQPRYKAIFLEYMIQDIRLLGGVMVKAQEMFWNNYNVDITRCLTASAISMLIFRMKCR